jgi:DNA-binding NtrC family response regulator
MRLLIVGSLDGHITAAGKIALSRGAKVAHVDDVDQAMHALRNGQGADLIMFDVALDTKRMIDSLRTSASTSRSVACGIGTSAETAVKAIKAGAKEYVPLPPGRRADRRRARRGRRGKLRASSRRSRR